MNDLFIKKAKILIVDDKQENIDVLEGLLENLGYTNFKSTNDSRKVVGLFESFKPDLILLDLMMPYLNGIQVMEQLSPMIPQNTYLPVLVLTASTADEDKRQALAKGAKDFLTKPFDFAEVALRIKNLLETRFLHLQLNNQNQILEEKVKERTAELVIALEKAEEMNRIKTIFFANMSHELRTPFVAIRGYAELLLEILTDPEDKELAEGIIKGADRLTDTLKKILSLTKFEFDKQENELKEINLSEIISDLFNLYTKAAEKKNLNFIKNIFTERHYNEEELIINFDEEALSDILNNLLSNAIKYTEKGSIELKADIENRNEGESLVIKVTDTGIGIPKEKQALIWDEFRQVSEGISRNFQGTGLGLAITKKRVELLKGKVSVESEEGKGSIFIVELPILRTGQVEKSTAVEQENDEPTEPVETNSRQIFKKILYVEDEKVAQNIIHKTLSNNYTIEIANSVEEALAKVKSQKYDAFLIDVNLGENMDGVQLMEKIREMPEYKETPMTAITAFAADSDREEFLAKGFTHYISKPFALKELKNLVQEMFG